MNTIYILSTATLPTWANALFYYTLGILFTTLHASFSLAGHAGPSRLKERNERNKPLISYWESRWEILCSSLLICSVITQIATISYGIWFFSARPVTLWGDIATIIALIMLIITGFILLPRALSKSFADRLTVTFLVFASAVARILYPFAWIMALLEKRILTLFLSGSDEADRPSSEDAIRSLVQRASDEDLEEEEREIINSVFEFGETITREIMTPRVGVEGLEDTSTVDDCITAVKGSSHSRFPVYHETLDQIIGVAHVKDLLRIVAEARGSLPIGEVIHEGTFVPESMPINDLLQLMRSERAQLAIVVDEYGGTAGLVTMEDIIEELVGEIHDEYDQTEKVFRRLTDGSAVIDASLPVDDVNELMGISIPQRDDYDSVGGFVFHELGRIPRPGEIVEGHSFELTIQSANAHRLHTMKVRKTNGSHEDP